MHNRLSISIWWRMEWKEQFYILKYYKLCPVRFLKIFEVTLNVDFPLDLTNTIGLAFL